MTQDLVAITTVIHTRPVMWNDLLDRVRTGRSTFEDEQVLQSLRVQLDCIAATYPASEYFRHLARLLGLHQQMSQAETIEVECEEPEGEEDEPEFPSQEEWELQKLYIGKVQPVILGGEK